jgi:amino acid adenylation domain-containing protein
MLYLLHTSIERAAKRGPERDAVRFAGTALTYGALNDRVGRLARVLRDRGVSRGDRVGILMSKGLDSAVAMYGIMKAGAAYVPLDALAPLDRLVLIAKDCGITHLVSERSKSVTVRAMLDAGVPFDTVVGFDDNSGEAGPGVAWEAVNSAPCMRDDVAGATEMDLAYILYTSGSTGAPKGVVHTHRSALSFAEGAAHTYGLRAEDRVTNHAPLHFDLSTLDFFATAVAGGTTVIVPEAHTRLPASLAQLLENERVSVVYAVPLALTQLVLNGALEKRDLSHIRWVIFAGEPFPPKHLRALMHALPQSRFSNIYGPTEVNGVTHWAVPPVETLSDEPLPIGNAFANVDLMVVDAHGDRVSPGETGELWVRSPTMMQGYWGRPDLDASAFAVVHGGGPRQLEFHKTGDLVRADSDGVLHFLGRKDRQIKTRGYRVELDEVESVLMRHANVEAAAVYGVPDAMGTSVIEASVVLTAGSSTLVPELIAHASRILPRYALPEYVNIVDALPRTGTEKIDRVALRTQALTRRSTALVVSL